MWIEWAPSADRHGINRASCAHVVEHATRRIELPAPQNAADDAPRLLYLGFDMTGELLEVIAVRTTAGALRIIHAMPMRAKYLPLLGDADA